MERMLTHRRWLFVFAAGFAVAGVLALTSYLFVREERERVIGEDLVVPLV
jgi:hypothetical protein